MRSTGMVRANQTKETDMVERDNEPAEMPIEELEQVSGGKIKWSDIHMPYKDFKAWPGGEPAPTRYA